MATTKNQISNALRKEYERNLVELQANQEFAQRLITFRRALSDRCGGNEANVIAVLREATTGEGRTARLNPHVVYERLHDGLDVPQRTNQLEHVTFTRELLSFIRGQAAIVFGAQTTVERRAALLAFATVSGFAYRLQGVNRAATPVQSWIDYIASMLNA